MTVDEQIEVVRISREAVRDALDKVRTKSITRVEFLKIAAEETKKIQALPISKRKNYDANM